MNKSLLSKLMAREDLEVIEGNFKTASFDPANRILRLPILKEEYSDAYPLFIGHEVGHALYTPDIFSHDSEAFPKIVDIPHSILNIVEDVRIERMVREFYPGLINDFVRGYKRLMEDNFFGIKDVDPNKLSFLDRLNLKAKLNNSIDLEFSFAESVMLSKVFEIQTFDDTISISRELMDFISKENEESKKEEYSEDSESENEEGEDSDSEEGENQKVKKEKIPIRKREIQNQKMKILKKIKWFNREMMISHQMTMKRKMKLSLEITISMILLPIKISETMKAN